MLRSRWARTTRSFGQKVVKFFVAEAGQPGPQPHVGREGSLGLQAPQVPDRLLRGHGGPAQQELAVERGAVQRPQAQAVGGHRYGQPGSRPERSRQYVTASSSACQEAAMMFSSTPTVLHVSPVPSSDSISTRVTAPVPCVPARIRTL